nr:transcription factor bHLH84 [Tanacetum cinerariifolium]
MTATDPQSVYARVDISTMLEEAVKYVKFLQLQIKLLSSDDIYVDGFLFSSLVCSFCSLDMSSSCRGSKFSNESLLERISCNIFITNFPPHLTDKELWNTCVKRGKVLDVYIPKKLSKQGKPFSYARFNKFNREPSPNSPAPNPKPEVPVHNYGDMPSFAKIVKGKDTREQHDEQVAFCHGLRFVLDCVLLKPNGEALRKCILSGPYKPTTVLVQAVEATDDSPAVPEHTTIETLMNMSPENKAHFEAEKEPIHLILTGIGDEIYSTVDACQTAQEM